MRRSDYILRRHLSWKWAISSTTWWGDMKVSSQKEVTHWCLHETVTGCVSFIGLLWARGKRRAVWVWVGVSVSACCCAVWLKYLLFVFKDLVWTSCFQGTVLSCIYSDRQIAGVWYFWNRGCWVLFAMGTSSHHCTMLLPEELIVPLIQLAQCGIGFDTRKCVWVAGWVCQHERHFLFV